MVEGVNPEPGDTWHLKGKVTLKEFLVVLALLVVHDLVDQRMYVLVIQRWQINPSNVTINTNHRRQACRKMQIRRTLFFTECQ